MVRYVRADSQALVSSMKTTIQQARELTSKLNQGSQHLVQSVDGKQLSGAAYTAGKGLFEQVIIPTIKRADQAIQSLEQDLARYRHAEMAVERWSLIDSELQQELIRSLQRQLRTIDYQIDMARQLESSLIGELAKPLLHAIHMDTQRLHNAKVALLDKLREAEQKLNGLKQFDHQTALLFENSLQQLKIVTQSIQVLNGTKVDSATGKYTLPVGFDHSWFTSVKKQSVTDEKKQIALTKGMAQLNLPVEAQKYYQEIMQEALKNVPVKQWDKVIQELNQLLLFDEKGNILRVLPANFGAGNGVIILKNGKNDKELTEQANKELDKKQWEALNDSLLQLATGVVTALTGLGITGLDFAGTYFSGGTLAAVGVSQAGMVAGATTMGAGAVAVTDAIRKMGVATSSVNYSFARNYGQQHKDLKPNNEYQSGEHDYGYKTDELGRVSNADANLKLKTHQGRKRHNPNTPDKQPDDHAGHIFADMFGGSPELNNLLSQAKNVNLKEYGRLERIWKKALQEGKEVFVKVKINYEGNSLRPNSFDVNYTIDGLRKSTTIQNVN
ncbi:DNA/RNA non-specific endonuclease [Enterococcus faecalis]|uniref:DNA/RNA non-specific endonuclease n=1 Tax=Enterococcus faecalis TaxID=1351 RepID=UPI00115C86AC|nr:DNA/RNA non-specific endonuclease [Enterococcus faecalis]